MPPLDIYKLIQVVGRLSGLQKQLRVNKTEHLWYNLGFYFK